MSGDREWPRIASCALRASRRFSQACFAGTMIVSAAATGAAAQTDPGKCDGRVAQANLPGVVVDEAGDRLFTTDADGRLTAVAARDGKVILRHGTRSPLAIVDSRLLTWNRTATGLNFDLLNTKEASLAPTGTLNVPLPTWATPDTQITVKPVLSACLLSVQWRAERPYTGGAKPERGVPGTESYQAFGWVSVSPNDPKPQLAEAPKMPALDRTSAAYEGKRSHYCRCLQAA